jgi:hypothetical protein
MTYEKPPFNELYSGGGLAWIRLSDAERKAKAERIIGQYNVNFPRFKRPKTNLRRQVSYEQMMRQLANVHRPSNDELEQAARDAYGNRLKSVEVIDDQVLIELLD